MFIMRYRKIQDKVPLHNSLNRRLYWQAQPRSHNNYQARLEVINHYKVHSSASVTLDKDVLGSHHASIDP